MIRRCGSLLGMLLWFAMSFLEQLLLCWEATAVAMAVEYFLYSTIPAQSIYSPLRYVNTKLIQ